MSGRECIRSHSVGTAPYSSDNTISDDRKFILAGYTVPCSGAVAHLKFCYQRSDHEGQFVTFYPGIWSRTDTGYVLIYSVTININSESIRTEYPCQAVDFAPMLAIITVRFCVAL